ncbi:hypothetical protein I7I48_03664 [Histoplasma ohiense]|nr:hypothetical protein I7I48_03664 [Histoplasma ohiense (nom. inval.)]
MNGSLPIKPSIGLPVSIFPKVFSTIINVSGRTSPPAIMSFAIKGARVSAFVCFDGRCHPSRYGNRSCSISSIRKVTNA